MAAKGKELSFEKALERLESIVADMESGQLPLDRTLSAFEEGVSLIRLCNEKLSDMEKKIEVLVRDGDQVSTRPMEEPGGRESSTEGDAF